MGGGTLKGLVSKQMLSPNSVVYTNKQVSALNPISTLCKECAVSLRHCYEMSCCHMLGRAGAFAVSAGFLICPLCSLC